MKGNNYTRIISSLCTNCSTYMQHNTRSIIYYRAILRQIWLSGLHQSCYSCGPPTYESASFQRRWFISESQINFAEGYTDRPVLYAQLLCSCRAPGRSFAQLDLFLKNFVCCLMPLRESGSHLVVSAPGGARPSGQLSSHTPLGGPTVTTSAPTHVCWPRWSYCPR